MKSENMEFRVDFSFSDVLRVGWYLAWRNNTNVNENNSLAPLCVNMCLHINIQQELYKFLYACMTDRV